MRLKWSPGWSLDRNAVAYATTTLGATMMHSVFNFYYVKIFLNHYHISQSWFQLSQVLFMIWNAVNDPLFGYCQDNSGMACVKSRRHTILYGAPLFVLSFLVPWFPWGTGENWLVGMHLITALCLYDTMFTFVLLAQCCLFTEISQHHDDRLQLIRYSQVCSLIGSSSVMVCEFVSNNLKAYHLFQVTTVVIAVLAYICMYYTGKNASTQYDRDGLLNPDSQDCNQSEDRPSMFQAIWQLMTQRNFLSFVVMNFGQTFHLTFLSNFAAIFSESLIPQEAVSDNVRSAFHGLLFIVPQVLVILGTPMIAKYGSYYVIRLNFMFKMTVPVLLYIIGRDVSPYILITFLLLDSSLSSATFSLFNISLSDVSDADMIRYNRKRPVTAMIFGTNALVVKPAISLAPMVTVAILNHHGYEANKLGKMNDEALALKDAMFTLICVIPVVVGAVQYVVWSQYTLRNTHEPARKNTEPMC